MNNNNLSLFPSLKDGTEAVGKAVTGPNCGVIVTLDGSFRVFENGTENLTTDQSDAANLARRKCAALALALSNEQLMAILYDVMDNTEVMSLLEQPAHG